MSLVYKQFYWKFHHIISSEANKHYIKAIQWHIQFPLLCVYVDALYTQIYNSKFDLTNFVDPVFLMIIRRKCKRKSSWFFWKLFNNFVRWKLRDIYLKCDRKVVRPSERFVVEQILFYPFKFFFYYKSFRKQCEYVHTNAICWANKNKKYITKIWKQKLNSFIRL